MQLLLHYCGEEGCMLETVLTPIRHPSITEVIYNLENNSITIVQHIELFVGQNIGKHF